MFKYIIWVAKLIFPLIYHYLVWIVRYSINPSKYSLQKRYTRVHKIVKLVYKVIKIDIQVRGQNYINKDNVYYFVGNHISFLDAVTIIAMNEKPVTFVAKIESKKFPIVGRIIKIIDGVFIERDNLKQEIKVLQAVKGSLNAQDKSWTIFAEGTRNDSYNGPMSEMKAGSFKIPLATKTKIAPFAIWGTQIPLKKYFKYKKYPVIVEFLPVIDTSDYTNNTLTLAAMVQEQIQTKVDEVRKDYNQIVSKNKKNKKQEKLFSS